jgi:hypothetical protein
MKRTLTALVLLCAVLASGGASGFSVSLEPFEQVVAPGSTASVNVNVNLAGEQLDASGFPLFAGEQLFGFDFGLSWDDTILSFAGFEYAPELLGTYVLPLLDPGFSLGAGQVAFNGVDLLGGLGLDGFGFQTGGTFRIATVSFLGLGLGTSPLALSGDVDLVNYLFTGGALTPVSFDGSLTVAPVPEPGTMVLLGSGLVGFLGFRRRRKAA